MPGKTILYASYISPFPTNSGERIRAVTLFAALQQLGYRVEAVVANYDGVALEAHNRDGLRFHQIPFAWPRLRQAASVYVRPQPNFVAQVEALHRASPLSAIILDYGFMGAQIAGLRHLGIPILLGTHNLESALTGQVPRGSIGGRAAIRLRQMIELLHERHFFSQADAVICVSEEDRVAYRRFIRGDRLHLVPNFVDIPDVYGDRARENRIILPGSYSNFQNVEGLRWFIENVWDSELQSRATLCAAGKLSDEAVKPFARIPGIVGLGPRDDLLSEVARARAAIVPIWHGGGTRFKCLEAMAVRTPVVTTSKGCEGIEHEGAFLVADTAVGFKAGLLALLDDPAENARRAGQGRAAYDRTYSLTANAARLEAAIAAATRVKAAA